MKSNQSFYVWEQHNITLIKSPEFGYGIAISGGCDKGANDEDGDLKIFVSDVLKDGPADGKIQINDKILSVNGVNVENVEHEFVARLLKESKDFINLLIKRKIHLLNETRFNYDLLNDDISNYKKIKISLNRNSLQQQQQHKTTNNYGIVLGCKYYIKDIIPQTLADSSSIDAKIGDLILKINDIPIEQLSLLEAKKILSKSNKDKLNLTLIRPNTSPNEQQFVKNKPQETLLQPAYSQRPSITNKIEYRTITFQRENGLGVRISGGNRVGIFVSDVQFNSPADRAGLKVGDKIFKVNDVDYLSLTREEAVKHLSSIQSTIQMHVANMLDEYESSAFDPSGGDSFYIRTHFNFIGTETNELSFKINDIIHITDTLFNGVVGNWVATRLNLNDDGENVKGIIPNLSQAENLAKNAPTIDQVSAFNTKTSFKSKFRASRRSKSQQRDDPMLNLKVSKSNSHQNSKYLAYERVILREINFKRPIVIFGPLADVSREKLKIDYPDKYEIPESYSNPDDVLQQNDGCGGNGGVIKVASIKNIIQKGKHCLLDITPNAVDHLNYANFFPIVVNLKADSRTQVKELRQKYAKHYKPKSSKRIFENSVKQQKFYSHLFTANISLDSANWYRKLKEIIDSQQNQPVWVAEEIDFPLNREFNGLNVNKSTSSLKKRPYLDDNFELQINNRNTYDSQSTNQSSYESENEYGQTRPTNVYVTTNNHQINDDKNNQMQRFNSDSNLYHENETQIYQQNHYPQKYMTYSTKHETYYRVQQAPKNEPSMVSSYVVNQNQEYENYNQFEEISNNSFTRQKSFNNAINGLHNNQKTFANLQNMDRGTDAYKYVSRSTAMSVLDANNQATNINLVLATKKPPPPPVLPKPSKSLSSAILTQKKLKSKSELNINSIIPNDTKTNTFLSKITAFNTVNNKHLNRVTSATTSSQISSSQGYHSDTMESNLSDPVNDNKSSMLKIEGATSSSLSTISTGSNNLSPSTNSDAQNTPPLMSKSLIAFNGSQNQSMLSKSYHDLSSSTSIYLAHYNENGLYKRIQIESDYTFLVISTESGLFDWKGGLLESNETGVSLTIPEGALSRSQASEIYFKVCLCKSLDFLKNPLVLCGPRGLHFTKPVKLHIPLFKSIDGKSWSYVPKSHEFNDIKQSPTSVDILIDYF